MKLTDLHPEHCAAPNVGGWQLLFDCPRCGSPKRVSVYFSTREPVGGVWKMTSPLRSFPGLSGEHPDMATLTLVPSIGEPYHGRVEQGRCTWHGNITNGEVTNA